MKHKRWMFVLLVTASAGIGTVFLSGTANAQPPWCVYPQTLTCRGASVTGGWSTGPVSCDPAQACACPLPQHDYSLIYNQCAGQVP